MTSARMRPSPLSTPVASFILFSLLSFILLKSNNAQVQAFEPVIDRTSAAELFEIADEIVAVGPSRFPKPTDLLKNSTVEIIVNPTFGKHRPDQDAVMAYAEGYSLPYYMMFIETLRNTGFQGDIVLAIAHYSILADHVLDYLKQQPNVVVYVHELQCFESDRITPSPRAVKRGSLDIFQMCQLPHVYGWKDRVTGKVLETAPDPRIGRVVATLRYEWYWIWTMQYHPDSWMMLIDARDSFFQTNPFSDLPRRLDAKTGNRLSPENVKSGLLYMFGENAAVTRLGISTKNRNWLRRAYGETTIKALANKPTICSGSTMGEQVAIETYLRAMVNEWDETDIHMTGADQGFHNYLYYSNKLMNSNAIDRIIVWEQGRGIINNLGALRTKTFAEWGFYDNSTGKVYNWDGTLSPVAHQWDRDKHLHTLMTRDRFKAWEKKFLSTVE